MSTLSNYYKPGDQVEVKVLKPTIGTFPIARVVNHNVTCLFEKTKKFFELDSIWLVEVTEVKERNLTIKPIKQVKSKLEVENDLASRIEDLKSFGNKTGNIIFK